MKGGITLTGAADSDLLTATAQGDRAAFTGLYDRCAGPVYRFCLARLRNAEAAADACQETFAAVWSGAGAYAGTGPVLAWILGIARRKVVDQRRAAGRAPVEPLTDDVAAAGHAGAVEEAVDVWAAVSRLPEGQQEAVVLTYGLGLSCPEAGEVMGVPAGTVKSRLHAARASLARMLQASSGVSP